MSDQFEEEKHEIHRHFEFMNIATQKQFLHYAKKYAMIVQVSKIYLRAFQGFNFLRLKGGEIQFLSLISADPFFRPLSSLGRL